MRPSIFPPRSIQGLLLLFIEPYRAETRESQKFVSPGMKVSHSGSRRGKRFVGRVQHGHKCHPLLHGREVREFHYLMIYRRQCGSGLRLVYIKDGVQLEIRRTSAGSGNLNCHVFVVSDPQLNLFNEKLDSIQF